MPLVTITCSDQWFPTDSSHHDIIRNQREVVVLRLAAELPKLICAEANELCLDVDTPEEVVQVDLRKFHVSAINAPDLWFRIELTEELSLTQRQQVRDRLLHILQKWLADRSLRPSWALDVFFGPGHGGFVNEERKIVHSW